MNERSAPVPKPSNHPEMRRFLGRFPGSLPSVGDARYWLWQRLDLARVPEPPRHDALLILSEIATNALLHAPTGRGGGAFLVSVFTYARCLRVAVRATGGPALPRLEVVPTEPDAEHGRGLFIVNSLADSWGIERTRCGPSVYFTLEWDQDPEEQDTWTAHRFRQNRFHTAGVQR
ncbi:ATP-binding protein [Nocardiopsis sp. EMB25]|uniref:ATP-binding protein n=1 Tax=Nocardiopsis sp. EMB25 TaxID=2835867 RepID=UPI0022832E28|nr:ATP-binding protein [Nocardiopsis sp. EMB25]MCY9783176.1 ATP-binding protein [Nocardiopsis sp. EMB25]